jgi:hypothetical protein
MADLAQAAAAVVLAEPQVAVVVAVTAVQDWC